MLAQHLQPASPHIGSLRAMPTKREYINNWKKSICSHSRLSVPSRPLHSLSLSITLSHPDWAIFYSIRHAASFYMFPQPRKIYLYDFLSTSVQWKWAEHHTDFSDTAILMIKRRKKNAKSFVSIKILFRRWWDETFFPQPLWRKKIMTFFFWKSK